MGGCWRQEGKGLILIQRGGVLACQEEFLLVVSKTTPMHYEETNLVQQMDDVFYELQKWVDVEDKKVRG